jgi:hypothetical protein
VSQCLCGQLFLMNWLQVSSSTKPTQIDEREGDEFESAMTLLLALEAQKHSFEFVFPGKDAFDGRAHRVNRGIEKTRASALGVFSVARICLDVGFHPRVENVFAVCLAVKACVEIERRTGEL